MTHPGAGHGLPRLTPCGRTRREFIWQAGGGFVGTALTWLLAQDGFLNRAMASESLPGSLSIPKPPHFAPKAKSCIFLFMYGGPSHVDLFDPKPELTKRDGQPMPNLENDPRFDAKRTSGHPLLGSLWPFAKHGQSGIEMSSLFPKLAERVDDLAILRSCHADSFAHGSGLLQMNTGMLRQGFPSLGSWVTYGLGTVNQNLPAYVVLLDHRGGPIGGAPNWGAGFMPAGLQGTQFRTSGDPIIDLSPREGVTRAQQRQQLDLLAELGEMHREHLPSDTELAARLESYELAFRMQQSAPDAVDLSSETPTMLEAYGLNNPQTEKFARRCLMARRLVERGVRFVQVYSGGGHLDENWDAHAGHETQPRAALRRNRSADRGAVERLERPRPVGRNAGGVGWRVRPHAHQPGRQQGARPQPARLHHVDGRRRYQGRSDLRRHRRVRLCGGREESARARPARHDPALDGSGPRSADVFPFRPRLAADRRRRQRASRLDCLTGGMALALERGQPWAPPCPCPPRSAGVCQNGTRTVRCPCRGKVSTAGSWGGEEPLFLAGFRAPAVALLDRLAAFGTGCASLGVSVYRPIQAKFLPTR